MLKIDNIPEQSTYYHDQNIKLSNGTQGGEWNGDVISCLMRSKTRRDSTKFMGKFEVFSRILSNDPKLNPGTY